MFAVIRFRSTDSEFVNGRHGRDGRHLWKPPVGGARECATLKQRCVRCTAETVTNVTLPSGLARTQQDC